MVHSSHHLGEASMDMVGVLEASEKGSTSAEGAGVTEGSQLRLQGLHLKVREKATLWTRAFETSRHFETNISPPSLLGVCKCS